LTNHLLAKDFIPARHKDGGQARQRRVNPPVRHSAKKTADKKDGGQEKRRASLPEAGKPSIY